MLFQYYTGSTVARVHLINPGRTSFLLDLQPSTSVWPASIVILWLLWLTPRQDSDFQLQKTNSTVPIKQSPVSFLSQRINHTPKQ